MLCEYLALSFCTENGGGVLWQHHGAAATRAGVLQGGILWSEISLLPQGELLQYLHALFVCHNCKD